MCVPHAWHNRSRIGCKLKATVVAPSWGPCTCGIGGNGLIPATAQATAQANAEPASADAVNCTEAIDDEGEVDCTISHIYSDDEQGIIFGSATTTSAAASSSFSAQPDDAAEVRPGETSHHHGCLGLDACRRLRTSGHLR
jgi:hypothetical protein